MGQVAHWGGSVSRRSGWRRTPAVTLNGLGDALATILVIGIGTLLALVFAATLAVVVVLAAVLLGLAVLTSRLHQPRRQAVLIQARKRGHSWVAYDWDRRRR